MRQPSPGSSSESSLCHVEPCNTPFAFTHDQTSFTQIVPQYFIVSVSVQVQATLLICPHFYSQLRSHLPCAILCMHPNRFQYSPLWVIPLSRLL